MAYYYRYVCIHLAAAPFIQMTSIYIVCIFYVAKDAAKLQKIVLLLVKKAYKFGIYLIFCKFAIRGGRARPW